MATIPMGNFGRGGGTAPLVRTQAPGGRDATGSALENLGENVSQLAQNQMVVQDRAAREAQEQAEAMARAKAGNAQLSYEIEVGDKVLDLEARVGRGEVDYRDAEELYRTEVGKIQVPQIDGLPPDLQERFSGGITQTQRAGELKVGRAVGVAQRADFQGQFDRTIDQLDKIAGMPDADIPRAISMAEAAAPLARQAGNTEAKVAGSIQAFKDRAWTSQATQRAMFARNDVAALKQVEHDLSSETGFYADKLDPAKRNALLSQVLTRQQALEDRAARELDRADGKAERTIAQIDQQIASGVPATPAMWAKWSDVVKGSSFESDFNERVQEEQAVQSVLRLPPAQQQTFIQQAETELLTKGGSVRQKANLDRLKTAVETNLKQLAEAPLLFNQNRMGDAVAPLNLQALADPAGAGSLGAQLQERASIIEGMRKQYGEQVPMFALLPQEARALKDLLGNATPRQQAELFTTMRGAIRDDKLYTDVMKQLAPEDPVLAYAGMIASRDRSITLERHWLSANTTVSSGDVATTMLEGAKLLKQEGDKKFPLPKDGDFRTAFVEATGSLFAGRPGAADVAMQAVRAYYTGKAASDGDVSGEVDATRMTQAIRASLGEVADVNGNGEVLAPWGMDADSFEDKAEAAFVAATQNAGLPQTTVDNFGAFGLRQRGENTFYVVSGREFLTDRAGNPLIITIAPGVSR